MPRTATQSPRSEATVSLTRVVFVTTFEPGDGRRLMRTFADPRAAVAVAQTIDRAKLPNATVWPEPTDRLDVLVSTDRRTDAAWMARPAEPDAPLAIEVPVDGGRVRWRPGRAAMEGPIEQPADVLAALVEFAFYEGELRAPESAVTPIEAGAADDVKFAYGINSAGQPHWLRFRQTMEQLATFRLTFARLEPHLGRAPRSLPPQARRAFARLCAKANVEDRLEAVSDRLEACEDLYEGAVDRITDHRWWHRGQRAEHIIVALLAVETAMLVIDLAMRLLGH